MASSGGVDPATVAPRKDGSDDGGSVGGEARYSAGSLFSLSERCRSGSGARVDAGSGFPHNGSDGGERGSNSVAGSVQGQIELPWQQREARIQA